jgi:hypothetical protein
MKTAKFKWVLLNDILVSCATEGLFDSETWDIFIKDLSSKPVRSYLVTTFGSATLTSLQRKQVSDVLSSKKIRVAVVTDDKIVQYMATAVSWLGVNLKAFPWSELSNAVRHVGAIGIQEQRILQAVYELRKACLAPT